MRSLVVVAALLAGLLADQQQRTIRLKTQSGDDHHSGSSSHGASRHPPEELPYCVADPNEHLHWTVVGAVITALLVSLIYVHQQYASVQYQHALLVRMYRSRAKRDEEDLEAIRRELKGRRANNRLGDFLDRKKKEMASDDARTARKLTSRSEKQRSVRRTRKVLEEESSGVEHYNTTHTQALASSPSPQRKREEEPPSDSALPAEPRSN